MVSVKFIRERARNLLKEFQIEHPPVPVIDMIEGNALTIERVEREDDYDGELIPDRRIIRINVRKPDVRQRFTLAHELGHWMLFHKERLSESEDAFFDHDVDDNRPFDPEALKKHRDREASIFAAELLMPTTWVKRDWIRLSRNVQALIALYAVSDDAMWNRVRELGLLTR